MKIRWVFLFVLLLAALFGGFINSQAVDRKPCSPAEVRWKFQGAPVRSFGCISMEGDSLVIINHILMDVPRNAVKVAKEDVVEIILYVPSRGFKPASKS